MNLRSIEDISNKKKDCLVLSRKNYKMQKKNIKKRTKTEFTEVLKCQKFWYMLKTYWRAEKRSRKISWKIKLKYKAEKVKGWKKHRI